MLNEESEQGQTKIKTNERISQCSTSGQHSTYESDKFYVDTEENPANLIKMTIDTQTIVYTHKKVQKTIGLSRTVIEESIYLRDRKTVYAIKISNKSGSTMFSTFQKDHFITLYLCLADKCMLTGFEKHYRVGKPIGNGAFGKVYDGFNLFSHQNVALKVMSKDEIKKTPNGMEMLYNQIHTLQRLRLSHISPLISSYQTTDCYILVLEKGTGGNLIEFLKNQPQQYNEKTIKCIFKQILESVDLLHKAGFIHRDIKPQNVICKGTTAPSVFLCDFGISIQKCNLSSGSSDRSIAGTIGYIAPEMINQEDYDEKSDVFSIGCMFFFLYTGRKLFQTKNFYELRYMTENAQYIKQRLFELIFVPFQVRQLLERMLKFQQTQRISVSEALKHKYFKGEAAFFPNLGQFDQTLRVYIQNKISHYWH